MPNLVNVSGIVLAGGMSRRLGRNKAVEIVGGQTLIQRVVSKLECLDPPTIVVVAELEQSEALDLPTSTRVVTDIFPGCGSLGGIYTGLSNITSDWGLVVACDMPFLDKSVIHHIIGKCKGNDVVAPVVGGRPEPIHAAYSKTCIPHIKERLQSNELKISGFFDKVRVAFVPETDIDILDPNHLSFMNVNTERDLAQARELIRLERTLDD